MSDEAALRPGRRIGSYEIVEHLGHGAMGVVWKALHAGLRHHVVIKIMHPELARDRDAYQRFLREGEAVARIRHPHVIEVHDVGVYQGLPYLVMEFLEGETLGDRLARERVLREGDLADVMVPVCAAVSRAHEEGVVHRDLKPENLFLVRTSSGGVHPKVLDFGISRVVDDRSGRIHTQTDTVLGTPLYMSPEQARGEKPIDDKTDQYALGVILYEGLTGRTPVDDGPMLVMLSQVAKGVFPPPSARRGGIDPRFEAIVCTALAPGRDARHASVRALGAALLPFAGERTRMVWAATFGVSAEAAVDMSATVQDAPAYREELARWRSEQVAADVSSVNDGTDDRATTVRRVPRRRMGWSAAAALGVAGMVIAMAVAWWALR